MTEPMASMISNGSVISNGASEFDGVLLLGATGRLGGMLRRHWPLPKMLRSQSRQPRPEFSQFDLPAIGERPCDAAQGARAIICLAGVTPARAAGTGAAMRDNVDLALAGLQLAEAAAVTRFFAVSSAAVYGTGQGSLSEDVTCTHLVFFVLDAMRQALHGR